MSTTRDAMTDATGAMASPGSPERSDSAGSAVPGPATFSGRQLRELVADDAWLDELIDPPWV
jgi:hypothetical protein